MASLDSARLKAWWLYRMLFSPDPLTERLVLLWHNHFATSNQKVQDLAERDLGDLPTPRVFDAATMRHVVASLLALPEAQLG